MDKQLPLSFQFENIFFFSLLAGVIVTTLLLYFSLRDHTQTGPRIKEEISRHYTWYAVYALSRLGTWCFLIAFCLASIGHSLYFLAIQAWALSYNPVILLLSGLFTTGLTSFYLFCHYLLHTPNLILSSARFRFSRLTPLWKLLKPSQLKIARLVLYLIAISILASGISQLISAALWYTALFYLVLAALYFQLFLFVTGTPVNIIKKRNPRASQQDKQQPPNIIMIGSDTLRADRLGNADYVRNLTPNIDILADKGAIFTNCYTPLARTAPSLASMLTGAWPHNHGIRTNYPDADQLNLPVESIIENLNRAGYETAAISDWSGADLGKIKFGFKHLNVSADQWNLKYLLRQGPSSIRLFLSLFCHNRLGKKFLPELYYLAGIPLTKQLFSETRELLSEMAETNTPFFINLFTSSTHVPFSSDYPYYNTFTPEDYDGEARFVMTKLASPKEILEKQVLGPEAFDIPQTINLYDGCVLQFDEEIGKLMSHLDACQLTDNTIIVIYSDHGADFFETGCWGQGNTLLGDDPSGRVPLLIVDPKQLASQIIEQTVRTIDITPTLLELLGLPIPATVDGSSLLSQLRGSKEKLNLIAYQETGLWLSPMPGMHKDHLHYPNLLEMLDIPDKQSAMLCIEKGFYSQVVRAKDRAVRKDHWKLLSIPTSGGDIYQLFNINNDPNCATNIAGEEKEIFAQLKKHLDTLVAADPYNLNFELKSDSTNTKTLAN
ncbi:MAG: sulfatase-like hydrolase/transferase [Candidatus Reddybacter sp.]